MQTTTARPDTAEMRFGHQEGIRNTIVHGDCIDVMRRFPDRSIDRHFSKSTAS